MHKATRLLWLSLIIFVAIANPVRAEKGWTVIWEGDYVLDEPAGVYEGYFLADRFHGNWPSGIAAHTTTPTSRSATI